ncbi:MAG: DUF3696 domain-containing protein [Thermoanaerobaculia bacterium]|nr:DUF3696 domain-containing protein [Thermoanaerobaculia bacterium]
MDKVIIEGVRCFVDRQVVPLRPLTVLVGENSSGKSTFLALTRIAWDLAHGQVDVDFNEEPFLLGAYEQIASSHRIPAARVHTFKIGAESTFERNETLIRMVFEGEFANRGGQPALREMVAQHEDTGFRASYNETEPVLLLQVLTSTGASATEKIPLSGPGTPPPIGFFTAHQVGLAVAEFRSRAPENRTPFLWPEELSQVIEILQTLKSGPPPRLYAFAPIRSRPQRTYDPLKETPLPEGSHVPMTLARLHSSESSSWKRLKIAIEEFGKIAGLFTGLDVRRLGKQEGDPFQLVVKIAGPSSNLVDVGYGVSQILPIIVDILRGEEGRTFLLQQPEVHLHPRAQAELGTFLATVAKTQNKRFVVETHSDYIVDRIRMDVRDRKTLEPKDVIVLYFDRQGGKTTIHPIEIDEHGNLVDVPKGYRDFFLQEERRFLEGEL